VFCPPRGETKFCFDDRTIATCRNGAISTGDCGAYGATCVDDDLGARCASVFCPPRGETTVCLDDRTLATCRDGAISTGDCGAYAAMCSTAGSDRARCVSVFCASGPDEAPAAHDVCLPNGQLAHCNADGIPEDARDCEAGTHCQPGGTDTGGGVGCFAGGSAPEGAVELASCDEIVGWARDADAAEAPIDVFLGLDGDPGVAPTVTIEASDHRADLCDEPGGCAHGFRAPTPLSLFDGAERVVHVYGGNVLGGGHRPLDGSPVTLRCELALPSGVLRPIGPDAWTSFGLSAAHDQLPSSETTIASLAERTIGAPWPTTIELVRVEGQAWLVDGEHRRRVDATSFAGFRFQDHLAEEIAPEELERFVVGPDLPPRPIVVARDDQLYMADVEPNGVDTDGGAPGDPGGGPVGGSVVGDPNALRGTTCAAGATSPAGTRSAGTRSTASFLLLFAFVCVARVARRRRSKASARSVPGSPAGRYPPPPTRQNAGSGR
jgi:hypothetical protein